MSRAALAALACLSLAATFVRAAEWNGGHVADGRCHRGGTLGSGPASAAVAADRARDPDRVGTKAPAEEDCHAVGPCRDPASACARARHAAVGTAAALIGAGVMGTPAAVPLMGAATSRRGAAEDEPRPLEIDGRHWREATPDAPERGTSGTRVLVDDRVPLGAVDEDDLAGEATSAVAAFGRDANGAGALSEPLVDGAGDAYHADADAIEESARVLADGAGVEAIARSVQALRLPTGDRPGSREFSYVDAMPTSWDHGGGGLMLEGSAAVQRRFRAFARLGAASDYQELLLGGSWHVTPVRADRLALMLPAGVESGRFQPEGTRDGSRVGAELADTGLYVGASSRLVVNDRLELQAGVGYSSFFEGDPIVFGAGRFHVGRQLDVVSRVEIGDNDSVGIGVRYHY